MPDLTSTAIETWLDTHGSEALAALSQTGAPEEHGGVLPAVVALGAALDAGQAAAPASLEAVLLAEAAAPLRTVVAQLGGPRRMRLLHWLAAECGLADTHGVLARLTEADPSGAGPFIQAWIADLHRRQALERIFDPGRIAALLAACREAGLQEERA